MPLSSLPSLSGDNLNVPDVVPSPDHTVLVRLPVSPGTVPLPHPSSHSDTWDQCHVRMPCSPKSQYPKNKASTPVSISLCLLAVSLYTHHLHVFLHCIKKPLWSSSLPDWWVPPCTLPLSPSQQPSHPPTHTHTS